jgi:hypothetical protein
MIGRREFCFGTLALFTAALTGCKEHVPVLKVPEDADECFDLFRFFTDPAFELERAKAGLGVKGEPRFQDLKTRKHFTFDDQPGILKSIDFQTGGNDRPEADKLAAIYIYYRTPIKVSLRRLESYLGPSNQHDKKIAAQIATFTNLQPGQKERERSSFGFYPDGPIAPGHLKGDLLFSCDTTSWDTKSVDFLRYERRVNV